MTARGPAQWWRLAQQRLWSARPEDLPRPVRPLLRLLRLALVLLRDLTSGALTLHAMGLVYTTLLSLVPLLALSFSVLKAFGVHNQVRPLLSGFLAPLGPGGEKLTAHIVDFIDRVNVGVLGAMGLALLLYTVISLMQKIEGSFNFVWHVTASRPMAERIGRYLSALLIGPVLAFAVLSTTGAALETSVVQSLLSVEPFGRAAYLAQGAMPYAVVVAAFTFLYMFVPNTRVRLGPALAAGALSGALWQGVGWAFAHFAASSTRYAAIYSGFAIVVLFMIWVYVSWLVLLFGASIAFYLQNPGYVTAGAGEPRLSNRMRERLALAVMALVARRYARAGAPWTQQELALHLGVPGRETVAVIDALVHAGVLARAGADSAALLPARDLATMSVADLLERVRDAGEEGSPGPAAMRVPSPVEEAIARHERGMRSGLGELTVASLGAEPQDESAAGGAGETPLR